MNIQTLATYAIIFGFIFYIFWKLWLSNKQDIKKSKQEVDKTKKDFNKIMKDLKGGNRNNAYKKETNY